MPQPHVNAKNLAGIQSLEKGARLLFALRDAARPLRLVEVALAAGMSRSQAHGYLASLVRTGLAARDAAGHYELGDASMQLGLAALGRADLLRQGGGILRALREAADATAFLAVWSRAGPVIVAKSEPAEESIFEIRVGAIAGFLTSATGRVFLAYLPDGLWRHLLPRRTPDERAIAAQIRKRGLCSLQPVTLPGRAALSAPVFGWGGELRATLTLVGASAALDRSVTGRPARLLKAAAAELSAKLGGAAIR